MAEAVELGRTKICAGEMDKGKGGRGSCHHSGKTCREGRRATSGNPLEVPASGPGGPHVGEERPPAFQRPQAHSYLQGVTRSKQTLGSAPGATDSVLSHAVPSAAKCAGHPAAGPGNDASPLAHRLTPQEVTKGDFNLHCITTDIFP